ncbi:ABC transporter permease [Amorphus sp. 3PC139-8]|uniref:ABC transporter permease n=1 Tax=Amorphus sp. 3PC139-8 TaxID=2735676 RepID=UPI00345D5B89
MSVLRAILVAAGLVLLWEAVIRVFALPPFILPPPLEVASAFNTRGAYLLSNALVTASEILLGLAIGVLSGMVTALTMSAFPPARRVILPVVIATQALPVFAIAPLLVLWFGYGMASKIVMATLIIYFPVASAFYDGLVRTEAGLLELARLNRASRLQTLALIRVPAALPSLLSGLKVAAAVAPIGAVVGEWVGSSAGLGFVMLHANARLQSDVLFAALALLAVMAVALRLAVDALARRLTPWAPETQ